MEENKFEVQPILISQIEINVKQINDHLREIIDFFDKNSDSNNPQVHSKIFDMAPSCRYFRLLRVNLCYFKCVKNNPDNNLNKQLLEKLTEILGCLNHISKMINDHSRFVIAEYHSNFETIRGNAETSLDLAYDFVFTKIDADINKIKSIANDATKSSAVMSDLKRASTKQLDDIKNLINVNQEKTSADFEKMQNKLKALDDQVVQVALAHSFSDRIKKLEWPRILWVFAVIFSLVLIPSCFIMFNNYIPFNPFDLWTSFAIRTPLALALFWFTWFSSKKYSYVCHVQDDYRYKYDLAMAYKGYSGEVMKLPNHEQLLTLLLGSLIENISRSPIDNIKPEAHSPWAETISPIIEKVSKQANK